MSWIPWKGGECPVPKDTLVQIKFQSGHIPPIRPAEHWSWKYYNKGHHGIISAYRLSEEK